MVLLSHKTLHFEYGNDHKEWRFTFKQIRSDRNPTYENGGYKLNMIMTNVRHKCNYNVTQCFVGDCVLEVVGSAHVVGKWLEKIHLYYSNGV